MEIRNYLPKKPLFISFEGGDGSGKTSQIEAFTPWFETYYGPVVATKEPGGDEVGKKIRELLLDPKLVIHDYAELFLFMALRDQFLRNIVKPNLSRDISVISDRFFDSTMAYQGYGRRLDKRFIESLNLKIVGPTSPNLTYILDINPEKGLENAKKRGTLSRIDTESLNFHRDVNEGFRKIAEDNPCRCVLISYEEGIENIQDKIREEFNKRFL